MKHTVLLFELVGAVKTFLNLLTYLLELVQGLFGFHTPSFAKFRRIGKKAREALQIPLAEICQRACYFVMKSLGRCALAVCTR